MEKDEGKLIGVVEKEYRCVIEVEEMIGEGLDYEYDSDDVVCFSSDEEDDEDDCILIILEGKKIIWKVGNI